jgi:Mrp family chromosome partitioning ATPase
MRALIDSLSETYDYLLLDSAPVIPVTDSVALAPMVDGVVVVIGSQTPKRMVQTTCSRLTYVGARILGVLLNGIDIHHGFSYRQYEPYYYSRESKDDRHTF